MTWCSIVQAGAASSHHHLSPAPFHGWGHPPRLKHIKSPKFTEEVAEQRFNLGPNGPQSRDIQLPNCTASLKNMSSDMRMSRVYMWRASKKTFVGKAIWFFILRVKRLSPAKKSHFPENLPKEGWEDFWHLPCLCLTLPRGKLRSRVILASESDLFLTGLSFPSWKGGSNSKPSLRKLVKLALSVLGWRKWSWGVWDSSPHPVQHLSLTVPVDEWWLRSLWKSFATAKPRMLHINPSKALTTRVGIFPTSSSTPTVLGHAINRVTYNPPLKSNELSSEAWIYETYI